MKFKEVLIKAMRISLIPSIEWKAIKDEQETPKELMWNFGFPIILFSALGRDFGLFFVAKAVLGYSLNLLILMLFNLLSWVVIPYILILFAAYILYYTLPKLGIETDLLRILKLVLYTFTPLLIVTFFVYLHPLLRILIPIGIYIFIAYTLYVFWYGVQELFDITLEKKLRFIVITIAVGFFVIFLAQHIYGLLLGWVMPGMEAYVK
ncbi:MAG: Yip1 family protein [Bacteroidales bacterium]